MLREESSVRSPFLPYPMKRLRTRKEAEEEFSRPAGRYTLPGTLEGTLASIFSKRVRSLDPLSRGDAYIGGGLPLNWERILTYLHEHGVTETPYLSFVRQAHDRPKLFNARLDLRQDEAQTDGRLTKDAGFGASFDPEEAISKTIGETLERHFLTRYKRSDLKKASYAEMRDAHEEVLDIHSLNGFLPWQKEAFPILDVSDTSPLYWVRGERFSDESRVWLPAQLVFWNYRHENEKMLARITTSGGAGHFSRDEAVLSALLEAIQRDAFLVYWLSGNAPARLDISGVEDEEISGMLTYLERYRMEPIFLDTTTDIGVPCITCVLIDRATEGGPVITLGSASGFDMRSVVQQSAIEAILVNAYVTMHKPQELAADHRPFLDASILRKERLTLWRGEDMLEKFSFFLGGGSRPIDTVFETVRGVGKKAAQLRYTTDKLAKLGYDIFLYEAKDRVLRELGYHVVRAIVPQLLPLYLWEPAATLDSPRLRSVPQKLGLHPMNSPTPWPHPFP